MTAQKHQSTWKIKPYFISDLYPLFFLYQYTDIIERAFGFKIYDKNVSLTGFRNFR